jgi:hypothetical protein
MKFKILSFPPILLQVEFDRPSMTLDILIKYGKFLVEEQDNVKRVQLADAYMAGAWNMILGCFWAGR